MFKTSSVFTWHPNIARLVHLRFFHLKQSNSWTRYPTDVSRMYVTAIVGYLRAVVRDPNTDITLQSSDNVLFQFRKK